MAIPDTARAPVGYGAGQGWAPSAEPVGADEPASQAERPVVYRSRARWIFGFTFLALLSLTTRALWNAFGATRAHGSVVGREVRISAPWEGDVLELFVEEGARVERGEPLARLASAQLADELASVRETLAVERASLAAATSRLEWEVSNSEDRRQTVRAELLEAAARLKSEQAQLEVARLETERTRALFHDGIASRQTLDAAMLDLRGRAQRVSELFHALAELRQRVEGREDGQGDGSAQLGPFLERIDALGLRAGRLEERIAEGVVRAPVDGTVLRLSTAAGERAARSQPLVTLLEAGSVELVLWVEQDLGETLRVGDTLSLAVAPHGNSIPARIVRIAESYEPAPPGIAVHYRRDEELLPVALTPVPGEQVPHLRPGAEVRWPLRLGNMLPRGDGGVDRE